MENHSQFPHPGENIAFTIVLGTEGLPKVRIEDRQPQLWMTQSWFQRTIFRSWWLIEDKEEGFSSKVKLLTSISNVHWGIWLYSNYANMFYIWAPASRNHLPKQFNKCKYQDRVVNVELIYNVPTLLLSNVMGYKSWQLCCLLFITFILLFKSAVYSHKLPLLCPA